MALGMVLGGCTSVPDAVNPVEWYRSSVDFFSGEEEDDSQGADTARAVRQEEENRSFPELTSVPERPKVASAEERRRIADGLIADRNGRRYSNESIGLQGEAERPLPGAGAGTPDAAPTTPVASSTLTQLPGPRGAETDPSLPAPPPTRTVAETMKFRLSEPVPPGSADGPPRLPGPVSADTLPIPIPAPYTSVVVSGSGIVIGDERQTARLLTSPHRMASAASGPAGWGLGAMETSGGGQLPNGAIKVATINFGNGSASLSERDRAILRDVMTLKEQKGGRLHVVGHASSHTGTMDPVRHKLLNFKMSAKRADSVAQELMRLGAAPTDVSVSALADTDPLYYEVMPTGEAGNRRAEIYLVN